MEWHRATEIPKPDTEVLAEVKGFKYSRFIVLRCSEEGWWQHIPRMNDIMPSDGWVGTHGLFVIRWAYIDEKDLALTWEDMSIIHDIMIDLRTDEQFPPMSQQLYEEVLRIFNTQKEQK